MRRRRLTVLLLVGFVLGIGCLAAAAIGASIDAREPAPERLPTPPETLSPETVGDYVTEYEEVRFTNEVLSTTEETITEIETSCSIVSVDSNGSAYAATVECNHWYNFETAFSEGHADGAPYRITYRVSDDGTERIGERRWV